MFAFSRSYPFTKFHRLILSKFTRLILRDSEIVIFGAPIDIDMNRFLIRPNFRPSIFHTTSRLVSTVNLPQTLPSIRQFSTKNLFPGFNKFPGASSYAKSSWFTASSPLYQISYQYYQSSQKPAQAYVIVAPIALFIFIVGFLIFKSGIFESKAALWLQDDVIENVICKRLSSIGSKNATERRAKLKQLREEQEASGVVFEPLKKKKSLTMMTKEEIIQEFRERNGGKTEGKDSTDLRLK